MRASIIIPCYNQAEFVAQAIQSALSQTYPDVEVIVVNDGSTDSSFSVMQRFSGQIKIIDQRNKGLAGARNAGAMNSVGDVILPLDADDWIEADYLQKTMPLMSDVVGIVSTDMHFFGIQNCVIQIKPTTLKEEMLSNRLPVCSLINRKAFLETGGYNPRLSVGYEDWSLWLDILSRGWRHAVVSEPLFHYRTKAQSMIREAGKHHAELYSDIKKLNSHLF